MMILGFRAPKERRNPPGARNEEQTPPACGTFSRFQHLLIYLISGVTNMTEALSTRSWFLRGLKHGIPISAGYFAVSFALGITCKNTGMNVLQSFIMSLTMLASSGEFAAVTMIGAGAGVIELISTSLIINLRYFLMSCSLTQKLEPGINPLHRLLLGYCVTDEIFGLSATVDGYLCPFYTYGITIISAAGWATGTALGVIVGSILPVWVTNGLSVAMYGMFLAVIIPPIRKNRFIGILVLLSMAASGLFSVLPLVKEISSGFRIIILTVLIAGIAAFVKPIDDDDAKAGQSV